MIEVEIVPRKWGNSLGIALPKDVVEQAKIKPNKPLRIFLPDTQVDASRLFNTLKISKSTDRILQDIRKGED